MAQHEFPGSFMKIEIETHDAGLVGELMGSENVVPGDEVKISEEAVLRFNGKVQRDGLLPGMTEIMDFTISFTSGMVAGVISNWLYARLSAKNVVIRCRAVRIKMSDQCAQNLMQQAIQNYVTEKQAGSNKTQTEGHR